MTDSPTHPAAAAEWFRDWFGEAYLSLYPHRDEEEAAAGVALFREASGLDPGSGPTARILDLACGAGRHLIRLREAGFDAVGMDLSRALLAQAALRPETRGRLVRGDMRALPFADAAFAGLVNFFTSFGYFLSSDEDVGVVREIRRVLRPGAPFLMDYLNAPRVLEALEPETTTVLNGRRVRQIRWVEGDQVFKRIEIPDGEGGTEVFHERVRLYTPEALETLLSTHGLRPERRFGGYHGERFGSGSPRLILTGRAA